MDEFSNLAVRDKFSDAPRLSLFRADEPDDTPSPGVSAGVKLTPAAESPKRSTRKAKAKQKRRPEDSPPWLHPSGRWCRKVKWGGKWRAFYFGRDESKAMAEWDRVKKYLLAGQEPPPADQNEEQDGQPGNPTLRALCNGFDESKERLVATGELGRRTQANYRGSTDSLIAFFGKNRLAGNLTAKDFEDFRASLAKGRGAVSLRGHVLNVRMVFKHGYENGLLANPARFGQGFKIPAKSVLRKARQAAGKRMFEADELRKIIDAAPQPLRAMILLGINCGFGATDVSSLPLSAVDLKTGFVTFPRPKTSVERRAPLWPETVKALREVIDGKRKEPRDPADAALVFLTRCGQRWVRVGKDGGPIDAVACEMTKLLIEMGIKRERVGFYALRHTFRTVADEVRDRPATDHIMGHADHSQAGAYREGIADERLQAVVNHVRSWLFPAKRKPR